MQSPLTAEMAKKPTVPAGGFIDLGKYSSILSSLLTENIGKIAPKVLSLKWKSMNDILQ